MAEAPIIFVEGMNFKLPHEQAPDFVKGTLWIRLDEFIEFANAHVDDKGSLNIKLNVGRSGKSYAALDTWKPSSSSSEPPMTSDKYAQEQIEDAKTTQDFDDEIPF